MMIKVGYKSGEIVDFDGDYEVHTNHVEIVDHEDGVTVHVVIPFHAFVTISAVDEAIE